MNHLRFLGCTSSIVFQPQTARDAPAALARQAAAVAVGCWAGSHPDVGIVWD